MHSGLTDTRFHLEDALSSSILYDTEAKIDVGCPENIGPSQSPICTAVHLYCENLSIFRIVFAFFFFFLIFSHIRIHLSDIGPPWRPVSPFPWIFSQFRRPFSVVCYPVTFFARYLFCLHSTSARQPLMRNIWIVRVRQYTCVNSAVKVQSKIIVVVVVVVK